MSVIQLLFVHYHCSRPALTSADHICTYSSLCLITRKITHFTASMIASDASIQGNISWCLQGNWSPSNQSETPKMIHRQRVFGQKYVDFGVWPRYAFSVTYSGPFHHKWLPNQFTSHSLRSDVAISPPSANTLASYRAHTAPDVVVSRRRKSAILRTCIPNMPVVVGPRWTSSHPWGPYQSTQTFDPGFKESLLQPAMWPSSSFILHLKHPPIAPLSWKQSGCQLWGLTGQIPPNPSILINMFGIGKHHWSPVSTKGTWMIDPNKSQFSVEVFLWFCCFSRFFPIPLASMPFFYHQSLGTKTQKWWILMNLHSQWVSFSSLVASGLFHSTKCSTFFVLFLVYRMICQASWGQSKYLELIGFPFHDWLISLTLCIDFLWWWVGVCRRAKLGRSFVFLCL